MPRPGSSATLRSTVRSAPFLSDVEPLVAAIRARFPEVFGIWLFGSLVRGTARADSDIDLAIAAATPLDPVRVFDLGLELGSIASRDVDLVDLRRSSLLLRHVVLTEGRLLHAADPAACMAFAADTAALWCSLQDEQRVNRTCTKGPAA